MGRISDDEYKGVTIYGVGLSQRANGRGEFFHTSLLTSTTRGGKIGKAG